MAASTHPCGLTRCQRLWLAVLVQNCPVLPSGSEGTGPGNPSNHGGILGTSLGAAGGGGIWRGKPSPCCCSPLAFALPGPAGCRPLQPPSHIIRHLKFLPAVTISGIKSCCYSNKAMINRLSRLEASHISSEFCCGAPPSGVPALPPSSKRDPAAGAEVVER